MKKNVLLVDDDRIFNFLSEKIIGRLGFAKSIQSATNGKEALELLSQKHNSHELPDIIFLDLNMPVMDGFEFIRQFNSIELGNGKRPMIVVVSSSSDQRDISRVRSLGVKHYLNKPITEESLLVVF
jgi:CheY-like chemotaxis protein